MQNHSTTYLSTKVQRIADAPMNKNRIEGRSRCDELAQHSEVAGSVAEVNAAVVPGSNAFLPGEIPEPETAPGSQPRP